MIEDDHINFKLTWLGFDIPPLPDQDKEDGSWTINFDQVYVLLVVCAQLNVNTYIVNLHNAQVPPTVRT
jgi:hypothetical protein